MTSSPPLRTLPGWPVALAGMALAAFASAALTSAAWAAPAEDRQRNLAATCTACHATDGTNAGAIPALAGRPRAELLQKLAALRDGTRPSTVMQQIARGYPEAELDAIAAWFSRQPAPAR